MATRPRHLTRRNIPSLASLRVTRTCDISTFSQSANLRALFAENVIATTTSLS